MTEREKVNKNSIWRFASPFFITFLDSSYSCNLLFFSAYCFIRSPSNTTSSVIGKPSRVIANQYCSKFDLFCLQEKQSSTYLFSKEKPDIQNLTEFNSVTVSPADYQ